MGNKIITEKDFWKCSCGAVPAQFQSIQKSTKKQSGEKFITVKDTATSSWIDFGCTRMMLIMAIIAAAVVVIAAMTVATGGAALIALGALAGLAGAAWGAVIGTMLCGQLAAKARTWVGSKNDYIIQGVETITGDQTMTCPVGGVITFAPEIKNWSQAIALGASNYISGLMEGMMAGAAIGMGGAALSGGAGAFASGGIRGVGQAAWQFARSAPMNVIRNIGATFGYAGAGASTSTAVTTAATAVGLRGLTATQAGLAHYGNTGESGWASAGRGVFAMEEGMYHSGGNILSGNASWQDVAGMALLLSPVHKAPEELKGKVEKPSVKPEETVNDGESTKAKEENPAPQIEAVKEEKTTIGDEADAYSDPTLADGNNVPEGIMSGKRPSSPEYTVLDSDGKLTEYGKWYYERPSWRTKTITDVWEDAKNPEGKVYDKLYPEKEITWDKSKPRGEQWHMGHKEGYEFSKHQQSAAQREIGVEQFRDEYNNASHVQPELPSSNISHKGEAPANVYYGF